MIDTDEDLNIYEMRDSINMLWNEIRTDGWKGGEGEEEMLEEMIKWVHYNTDLFLQDSQSACLAATVFYIAERLNMKKISTIEDEYGLLKGMKERHLHICNHWFLVALDMEPTSHHILHQYSAFLLYINDYKTCVQVSQRAIMSGCPSAHKVSHLIIYKQHIIIQ